MTAEFDFINYMREVAETLKEIQHTELEKHFNRVTSIAEMGEFLASMRDAKGYQMIVIDNMAGRFLDRSSDNLLVQPYHSLYILKHIPREDYDSRETAIKGCTAVVKKILSKMFYDKRMMQNGLTNLDRESITFNQAGPFGHNWHGLNFNFTVLDDPGIVYNAADWLPVS